ncbi:hypothetical protein ABPG77_004062 [Micractinium sp. CCAP 211/92]
MPSVAIRPLKSPARGMGAKSKARGTLPVRLGILVLATLGLGSFSLRQFSGGGVRGASAESELVRLGAASAAESSALPQEPASAAQPQSGSCFDKYTWIQPALDVWFEKAWAVANESTQTTEDALQALRDTMWNKYHPGMDEVILRPDGKGRVLMDILQVSPPNQQHKKRCMLGLLKDAVEAHNGELARLLGDREMHLIVETEDFGVTWKAQKNKIPAFAMCTDDNHSDIPVPDFTYYCYPETRYANSSWPAIQSLLQHKSDMLAWHERYSELFHRSNWKVGPRRGLMPLLQRYDNGTGPKTSLEAFGAELDIQDTGFVHVTQGKALRKHEHFVWLDGQCDYKYLIHTAGFSYSGGLKYKMACGSMVFKFESTYKEFFEPALQDQYHVVKLPAKHDGVDEGWFQNFTAPKIKEVVDRTIKLNFQPPIPKQGQDFVRDQLDMPALHCYWLGALQRYAELYFLPKTARQLELERQGGGSGGKAGGRRLTEGAAEAQEGMQLPFGGDPRLLAAA